MHVFTFTFDEIAPSIGHTYELAYSTNALWERGVSLKLLEVIKSIKNDKTVYENELCGCFVLLLY